LAQSEEAGRTGAVLGNKKVSPAAIKMPNPNASKGSSSLPVLSFSHPTNNGPK
jgi:hypothetical protein